MKKTSLAFLAGLVFVSGSASANNNFSYTCNHHHEQRRIEVLYLQRESSVPCEVRYIKTDSEETLWSASYTPGYCEQKAAEFVEKQEGWGWNCTRDQPEIVDPLSEDKE